LCMNSSLFGAMAMDESTPERAGTAGPRPAPAQVGRFLLRLV
jgi:hypothetical protein